MKTRNKRPISDDSNLSSSNSPSRKNSRSNSKCSIMITPAALMLVSMLLCCHDMHVHAFMNTHHVQTVTKPSSLFSAVATSASSSSYTGHTSNEDFFQSIVEDFCACIPSPTEPSSPSSKSSTPGVPTSSFSAPNNIDTSYNYYYNKINKNGKQRALLSTLNDFETFLSSELHEINNQRARAKQLERYGSQSYGNNIYPPPPTSSGINKTKLVSSPRLNTKEYNELITTLTMLHETYSALLKTRGSKHPRSVKTLQKIIQGYLHPSIINNPNTPMEHFINAKNVLEDILQTKSKFDDNPTQADTQREKIMQNSNLALGRSSTYDPLQDKMKRIQQLYNNDFIIFQSLAFVYMKLKLFDQAKEMYTDVMYELQSVALGPNHPDTLRTLHHIANVYSTIGDFDNARRYYLTCYVQRKKTLGSIHEDTISTLQQLSNLYLCHGKYYQAYVLCEKCYTNIVNYGTTDIIQPSTALMTFHNLALYYQQEGKLEKAKTLYEKCVLQQMKTLGGKDVDTLLTLHNLSTLYHDLGEYEKGIQTCQLCFMLRKDVLGLVHHDTIMTLCNLGMLYECQGKNSLAKSIYEVCYDVQSETLGRDNTDTMLTADSLKRLSGEVGVITNSVSTSTYSFMKNGSGDGEGIAGSNASIRSQTGLQNGFKKADVEWKDDNPIVEL